MESLISVIVPVYNVQQYLEKCVHSIIEQSYSNLEILLIDDGSTDGSGKKCDELLVKDPRIRVFHKKNGGLSDARNYGIERSKGNFLAFIDSDDAIHRDFFLELIRAQEAYDADIVSCELIKYENENEFEQLLQICHKPVVTTYNKEDALIQYFSPDMKKPIIYHGLCMKIYKKELFNNLKFEKGKLHEDLYITYQLLDLAETIVTVDCPYYFYFQNNTNSISNNYGIKNFLDEAEAYDNIFMYFSNKDRISQELIHFLVGQYLCMLEKGNHIRKAKEIQSRRNEIIEWTHKYVMICNYYGIVKKYLIRLSLKNIRIYSAINWIRGSTNR